MKNQALTPATSFVLSAGWIASLAFGSFPPWVFVSAGDFAHSGNGASKDQSSPLYLQQCRCMSQYLKVVMIVGNCQYRTELTLLLLAASCRVRNDSRLDRILAFPRISMFANQACLARAALSETF